MIERLAIAVAAMSFFVSTLDTGIVNIALPNIADGLHVNAAMAATTVSSYAIALSVTILVFGWLADRVGTATVNTVGFVLFAAFSLGCTLSTNIHVLIVFRALTGVAAAMLQATAASFVTRYVSERFRTAAFGWVSAILSLGPVLGPSLGGIVVSFVSWRWIFPLVVPICILGAVVAFSLRNAAPIPATTNQHGKEQLSGSERAIPFVCAVALGATFITVFVAAPFELRAQAHLAPWAVGLVLLCTPLAASISARLASRWLARFALREMIGGLALCGLAAAALLVLPGNNVALFIVGLSAFGAGSGTLQTPTIALSLAAFPSDAQAFAGALQRLVQNVAIAIGAELAGAGIDRFGTWSVWVLTTLFAVCGVAAVVVLKNVSTVRKRSSPVSIVR